MSNTQGYRNGFVYKQSVLIGTLRLSLNYLYLDMCISVNLSPYNNRVGFMCFVANRLSNALSQIMFKFCFRPTCIFYVAVEKLRSFFKNYANQISERNEFCKLVSLVVPLNSFCSCSFVKCLQKILIRN